MKNAAICALLAPAFSGKFEQAPPGVVREALVSVSRESSPEDGRTLTFIASTGRLDRFQEVIDPKGWQLEDFRRNPVFLSAHSFKGPTSVLGRIPSCGVKMVVVRPDRSPESALVVTVEFAVDETALARTAYRMYNGGFLSAVSVGFRPLKWNDEPLEEGVRRIYLEQELLEVSAVGVPANPDCLIVPGH